MEQSIYAVKELIWIYIFLIEWKAANVPGRRRARPAWLAGSGRVNAGKSQKLKMVPSETPLGEFPARLAGSAVRA